MYAFHISLILYMIVAITNGDYECLCNYAVQHNILSETDPIAAVIGELFEFDCKPTYRLGPNIPNWLAIQFNNKVGYVQLNDKTKVQTCPGQPSKSDIVIETTTVKSTTTTLTSVTPTVSSLLPTSLASTPSTTIKVTSDQTSPSTSKSTNLTTSTSPYLIVTLMPNTTSQRSTRTTLPITTSGLQRTTYPSTSSAVSTTVRSTSPSFSTSTTTPYPTTLSTTTKTTTVSETTKPTNPTTTSTIQEQTTTSTTTAIPTTTARKTSDSSTLITSTLLPNTSSAKLTTTMDHTTTSWTGTTTYQSTTTIQTTTNPTTRLVPMMKQTTKMSTPSTTLMTSSTTKPTTTLVPTTTRVPAQCPPQVRAHHRHYKEARGSCYEFIKAPHTNWYDAERDCNSRGGHLVSITSQAEQSLINTELWRQRFNEDDTHVWIGLTDKDKEGDWKWSSGERLTFTYWARGESNGNFEDCALLAMDKIGHWMDYPCSGLLKRRRRFLFPRKQRHGHVCEYNLV